MAMDVSDQVRVSLMEELKKIENSSDLSQMTILSRSGMKIATADSSNIDADPITASSAALIDIGVRFIENVQHGDLREILVRGIDGYAILQHIDSNFMVFAGLSNLGRIGFYLDYLRIKCIKFSLILSGGISKELSEQLDSSKRKQKEKDTNFKDMFETDISNTEDLSAMEDVLSFLDDWDDGGENDSPQDNKTGIVSIGNDIMMEPEVFKEPEQPIQSQNTEVIQDFLIYEGEVPPIPLDDVEALEISSQDSSVASEMAEEPKIQTEQTDSIMSDGAPNFESFSAGEYDDLDMDLSDEEEEDAIISALADLGYDADIKEKKKKKKK